MTASTADTIVTTPTDQATGRSVDPPKIRKPPANATSVTPKRAKVLTCDRNASVVSTNNTSSGSGRTRGMSDAHRTAASAIASPNVFVRFAVPTSPNVSGTTLTSTTATAAATRSLHALTMTG